MNLSSSVPPRLVRHAQENDDLNILLTASSYPKNLSDWRSVFIRHMAAAIARQKGIQVRLYAPPGTHPPGVISDIPASDMQWLGQLMDQGGIAHLLRNQPLRGLFWGIRLSAGLHQAYKRNKDCDLFHVNWLQCALFIPTSLKQPLLVTVLGSDMGLLKHRAIVARLRSVFSSRPTVIAPNAEWMESDLCQLFGDIATIQTVAFGIDSEWFNIKRQPHATQRKWLAIFRLTSKKIGPLLEWGENVFTGADQLHLIGPMQEQISLPSWVNFHGPSNPSALQTDWLPNAAGLITLSQHDEGRPQIMLESMAAGLPMVVSPLKAHTELLTHGNNGFLVGSAQELKQAINQLADPDTNTNMGNRARQIAQQRFGTWDDCARRYLSLYQQLGAKL